METSETNNQASPDNCGVCGGSGICDICGGNGTVYELDAEGNVIPQSGKDCMHCTAPGHKAGECRFCHGTGRFYASFYSSQAEDRLHQLNHSRNADDYEFFER